MQPAIQLAERVIRHCLELTRDHRGKCAFSLPHAFDTAQRRIDLFDRPSFSTLFPEDNEIGRYLKKRLPDASKKQRREVSGLMWQAVVADLLELGYAGSPHPYEPP